MTTNNLSLELYKEGENYCIYIGADNCSGIKVKGKTPEEVCNNMIPYMLDYFEDEGEE